MTAYAVALLLPATQKLLTTIGKRAGWPFSPAANPYVEMTTLAGRGVSSANKQVDAARRVGAAGLSTPIQLSDMQLGAVKAAVDTVIASELDLSIDISDITYEELWKSARVLTKAGSSKARPYAVPPIPEGRTRLEAVEAMAEHPLPHWDGVSYIGVGEKLEHGKSRIIYNLDTNNYLSFDVLAKAVERRWSNRHCLINPNTVPQDKLLHDLAVQGQAYLALDYEDFNSQHQLDVIKYVTQKLCEGTAQPAWVADKLTKSWDKMMVQVDGQWQPFTGTLPSGHRLTTIINSVLNAAYLSAFAPEVTDTEWRVTGDDVVIAGTLGQLTSVLNDMLTSPVRLNPTK